MNICHSLLIVHPLMDENLVVFVTTLIFSTNFTSILPIVQHDDYTTCK
jgi:hypothetical protein